MAKSNSYIVFVVDDDTKVLTMAKHNIEKNSEFMVEVHTFATGEDALARLDLQPDVIILDYYFDDLKEGALNGLEIQRTVKEKSPRTEIIFISGQDDIEVALQTIREGAYDYIQKSEGAIQRAQLAAEKVLQAKNREYLLHENNKNLRLVIAIMAIFLIALVGFVVYATMIVPNR